MLTARQRIARERCASASRRIVLEQDLGAVLCKTCVPPDRRIITREECRNISAAGSQLASGRRRAPCLYKEEEVSCGYFGTVVVVFSSGHDNSLASCLDSNFDEQSSKINYHGRKLWVTAAITDVFAPVS